MITHSRIETEKQTVAWMIAFYCQHKHHAQQGTCCAECQELLAYAHRRLDRCKFGEGKSTCQRCPVHCYRPDMRRRIVNVMRYAGPWMLLYHPVAAVKHLLQR